jgi:hypothetical protein
MGLLICFQGLNVFWIVQGEQVVGKKSEARFELAGIDQARIGREEFLLCYPQCGAHREPDEDLTH